MAAKANNFRIAADCLTQIVYYSDARTIAAMEATCKTWKSIFQSKQIWARLVEMDYPTAYERGRAKNTVNFFPIYRRLYTKEKNYFLGKFRWCEKQLVLLKSKVIINLPRLKTECLPFPHLSLDQMLGVLIGEYAKIDSQITYYSSLKRIIREESPLTGIYTQAIKDLIAARDTFHWLAPIMKRFKELGRQKKWSENHLVRWNLGKLPGTKQ